MNKTISPEQQWIRLKSSPISRGNGSVRHGVLNWEFDIRPSVIGRTYRIRITYKNWDFPNVIVLSPDLNQLAGNRFLPHVYSTKPVRLCLHYPESDEWTFEKSIAETIVPWSYLWLTYFEHWLATDEWLGGGKHPRRDNAE